MYFNTIYTIKVLKFIMSTPLITDKYNVVLC